MEKAFTYMFRDDRFWQKSGLVFLLYFVSQYCFGLVQPENKVLTVFPNSLFVCVLGLLIFMILSGYSFNIIKLIMDKNDEIVLPEINLANNLIIGLKWILSIFLFILAFTGVYIAMILLNAAVKSVFLVVISVVLFIIALLVLMIFFPALIAIFAKTEKIFSIFRFGMAKKIIVHNPGSYFTGVGFILLLGVLLFVIAALCLLPLMFILNKNLVFNLVYTSVIYSLISTYSVYVTSYLYAKMVDTELIEAETEEL